MTQPLITRLSKLDAPDREVDAELEAIFVGGRVYLNDPEGKEVIIERPIDGFWIRGIYPYRKIARYTASVDAAVSLTDCMLPGANVLMGWGQTNETKPWARIGVIPSHDATGFNLATALCIALLRAKEASL